jgi:hypothetical protein
MIIVFFVISLLHIPVMKIYYGYDNFSTATSDKTGKMLGMGNMGFSTTKCLSSGMLADKILLSCKTGLVSEIVDFGYISKSENKDMCTKNSTGVCANAYNSTKVQTNLKTACVG